MNKEFKLSLKQLHETLVMCIEEVDMAASEPERKPNLVRLKENLGFADILARRLDREVESQLRFQAGTERMVL